MNYRRLKNSGATYFFTVVTYHRHPIFKDEQNIRLLRLAIQTIKIRFPFHSAALVLVPDHLHCIAHANQ